MSFDIFLRGDSCCMVVIRLGLGFGFGILVNVDLNYLTNEVGNVLFDFLRYLMR